LSYFNHHFVNKLQRKNVLRKNGKIKFLKPGKKGTTGIHGTLERGFFKFITNYRNRDYLPSLNVRADLEK